MSFLKSARIAAAIFAGSAMSLASAGTSRAGISPPEYCPAGQVCFWSGHDGTGSMRKFPVSEEPSCVDLGRIHSASAGNTSSSVIVLAYGTCARPGGELDGDVLYPLEFEDLAIPLNEPELWHAPEGAPQGYSQQYHYNSYGQGHDP